MTVLLSWVSTNGYNYFSSFYFLVLLCCKNLLNYLVKVSSSLLDEKGQISDLVFLVKKRNKHVLWLLWTLTIRTNFFCFLN
jgi:hypothetical protein